VSKQASQARWLESAKGKAYHHGDAGLHRVREWRAANPGYWRRKGAPSAASAGAACDLRELLAVFQRETCDALQDSWPPHVVALVGMLARLGRHGEGPALQDAIARELREIMVTGNAILAALENPQLNGDAVPSPAPR